MAVSRKRIETYLKAHLTKTNWALKALMVVYDNQEPDEKTGEQSIHSNGMGFSKFDAKFLTSLARQYRNRGNLSPKQIVFLKKKIGRYWRQILAVSNLQKIETAIAAEDAPAITIPPETVMGEAMPQVAPSGQPELLAESIDREQAMEWAR